jgi:integration host factor subunit alpha
MRTSPGRRTVTRADLEETAYQAVFGPSRNEVGDLIRETFAQIGDALVRGETVKISRFGVFIPVRMRERTGRNPKQPTEVHRIPAQTRAAFRPAAELKQHVRTGQPE